MNHEQRYLGKTADELLDQATRDEPSPAILVQRLQALRGTIQDNISEMHDEARRRFEDLARSSGREPESIYKNEERELRLTLLKEQAPAMGKRLAAEQDNRDVQEIWNAVVVKNVEAGNIENMDCAFKEAVAQIDALDPGCTKNGSLKRILDLFRSECCDSPAKEVVLRFALYKVGRNGPDDERDRIEFLIDSIDEANGVVKDIAKAEAESRHDSEIECCIQTGVEAQYRIDWQGTRADCAKLIKFLAKHRYIKASKVNQFISLHFSFKGEIATAESLGKLKTVRDGSILEYENHLEIPAQL